MRVTALIERYANAESSTYLLTQVRDADTDELLTDHLWMPIGDWASGFRPGDQIRFTARVEAYVKGWLGDPYSRRGLEAPSPQADWHLVDVADAEVIRFGPTKRMMPDGSIRGGERA